MTTTRRTRRRFANFTAGLIVLPLLGACSSDESAPEKTSRSSQASHPEESLAGSNFEIDTDANLKVDDASPSIDWANVAEVRRADKPTGGDDDSFGQGSKEDSTDPVIVDGSIPPNKSDLKFFGVYQEGGTTNGFLNLFWSRVQDPSGTTNMDFEFNQNYCDTGTDDPQCSDNDVTPLRLPGDLLVIYDLSQGGTHPTLSLREWTGTKWGPPVDLTSSAKATGSINTSAIPAGESDGLGAQDPRTFGEAQVALSAIFTDPTICKSFGSVYLKSRSSDSFTAALKDFVSPQPVNISNCGSVKIVKKDDAGAALAGAQFTLYKNLAPIAAPRGAEDTVTSYKCTTAANGICIIQNVLMGDYWAVETVVPANHDGAADQAVNIPADTQVELSFVDIRHRGAIKITKTRKHVADGAGNKPHAGVTFTIGGVLTAATDANGVVCVDNLLLGNYTVHENLPSGYSGEADKVVTVDNKASCADSTYVGETVAFSNTPLSGITVSFAPEISGATAAKISCSGTGGALAAKPVDATPTAFDDVSENYPGLLPGTYTCTVEIDP